MLCFFASPTQATDRDAQAACSEQGVICRTYTLITFESKNGTYYAGYVDQRRRLPPGALRPPDSFDAHRIPMHLPEEDINDMDHYSSDWLCYDKKVANGTDECRQAIQPQPEIGQIHPEVKDPKRRPYNLLVGQMNMELDSTKAQ